jgi:hypothetical protein
MKNISIKILSIVTVFPLLVQLVVRKRKKAILRKKVLAEGIDDYANTAKNIANSISKGRALYKELITKVHPDRFTDERKIIATELSAKITGSKRNFDELTRLKIQVEKFLTESKK